MTDELGATYLSIRKYFRLKEEARCEDSSLSQGLVNHLVNMNSVEGQQ